jgi:hypothetical protein
MVSKCANPCCGVTLTSLSEGRLFQFEIVSISVSAVDRESEKVDESPQREVAHFWLCSECASSMTLTLEPIGGLRLLPRDAIPTVPQAVSSLPKSLHDC